MNSSPSKPAALVLATALLAPVLLPAAARGQPAAPTDTGPPADAFGCDPDVSRLVRAAAPPEGQEDADGLVVLDRSTVRVDESGQAHVVRRRALKALTEAGATALSALRFDYDPATSLLEVRRVVLHRADGFCVDVPLDGLRDVPQPAWSIYWGLRAKLLAVPRPEVGDAVETEIYFTGFQIAYLDQPQDDERFVPP